MLRDDLTRPHRVNVSYIRELVKQQYGRGRDIDVAKDIDIVDGANEAYIKAKVHFSTVNSDETMINLVGTWARMTKVIHDMDDKYGVRR